MRGNRVVVSLMAILALLFGIYAIGAPVVEISMFGHTESATFAELDGWSVATTIVRILNVVAILLLLVPVWKQTNRDNVYYAGVGVIAVAELIGAVFFVQMKNQAVQKSGLQGVMDFLSVECTVTDSFVKMVCSTVVVLFCAVVLVCITHSQKHEGNAVNSLVQMGKDFKSLIGSEVFLLSAEIIALCVAITMIAFPVLRISGLGTEMTIGLEELASWKWMKTAVWAMNAIAIIAYAIALRRLSDLKMTTYIPAILVAVLELIGAGVLLLKKGEAVRAFGLDQMMDVLSVSYTVTWSFWVFVLTAVVTLVAAVAMLVKQRK